MSIQKITRTQFTPTKLPRVQAEKVNEIIDVINAIIGGTAEALDTPLVTTPVSTVKIKEYGNGRDFVTVLTLTNFVVGTIPSANAALGVGNIVCAFPTADYHLEHASFLSLAETLPGAGVTGVIGLGSVIATGTISVLSGTGTFQDRLAGVAITSAAAGGTAAVGKAGATAGFGTGIALNVAASVKNVFVNAAGTWATVNAGTLTVSGTITLKWTKMGIS
jgi:hypothetical protein